MDRHGFSRRVLPPIPTSRVCEDFAPLDIIEPPVQKPMLALPPIGKSHLISMKPQPVSYESTTPVAKRKKKKKRSELEPEVPWEPKTPYEKYLKAIYLADKGTQDDKELVTDIARNGRHKQRFNRRDIDLRPYALKLDSITDQTLHSFLESAVVSCRRDAMVTEMECMAMSHIYLFIQRNSLMNILSDF
ncbi:hypothetical protein CAPTEDRAFT_213825 [Capitella teleta]|uniref:Uncharacterized protein n=1 Tax=Capitella teleta TaxID=283909 RepID=R7U804_CAPTE|nr:hypothetical protein CAPTEDRAFT_213825 [Capitella teleta]|eukprot:ELU02286.1 hypothetical protein CAPTEDRAFT_213825 [Capitella teleta]